jgi:hypothetical protein
VARPPGGQSCRSGRSCCWRWLAAHPAHPRPSRRSRRLNLRRSRRPSLERRPRRRRRPTRRRPQRRSARSASARVATSYWATTSTRCGRTGRRPASAITCPPSPTPTRCWHRFTTWYGMPISCCSTWRVRSARVRHRGSAGPARRAATRFGSPSQRRRHCAASPATPPSWRTWPTTTRMMPAPKASPPP